MLDIDQVNSKFAVRKSSQKESSSQLGIARKQTPGLSPKESNRTLDRTYESPYKRLMRQRSNSKSNSIVSIFVYNKLG